MVRQYSSVCDVVRYYGACLGMLFSMQDGILFLTF